MVSVELAASIYNASIRGRLATSLNQAESLRAVVAYWIILYDFVSDRLALCLASSTSCIGAINDN